MLSIQVLVDLLNAKIPNTKYLTYKLYVMLWLDCRTVRTCFFCALQNSKLSVNGVYILFPFTGFNGICALDVTCKPPLI